jgi:hypothetical protein
VLNGRIGRLWGKKVRIERAYENNLKFCRRIRYSSSLGEKGEIKVGNDCFTYLWVCEIRKREKLSVLNHI